MGPKVWRVRVDVDPAMAPPLATALRPPSRHPLPVHKLPAAAVGRNEVQEKGVHGTGVQTGDAHLQDREHPAVNRNQIEIFEQNWIRCKKYWIRSEQNWIRTGLNIFDLIFSWKKKVCSVLSRLNRILCFLVLNLY